MSVTPFTVAAQAWVFSSTTTAADPGAGFMRFSHATAAATTALFVDDVDVNGTDRSLGIATLGSGDVIRAQKPDDVARWEQFVLTGSVIDQTGWFRIPVTRTIGSAPKLDLTNGAVMTLTVFAPGESGFETNYASVQELGRILGVESPSSAQQVAMERVLDAAAAEINYYLGIPLPLAMPYPALIVTANLELAAIHWNHEQSPSGFVFAGGTVAYASRDYFRRQAQMLLPMKQQFGVG